MNDLTQYRVVAPRMLAGDVIVFEGTAFPISQLIRFASGSPLSHAGMVKRPIGPGQPDILLTNSTIEKGVSGPQDALLGTLLANYGRGARAWWLSLAPGIRALIDWKKFYFFIAQCENGTVKYDVPGLFGFIARQIPVLGSYVCQSETMKRMFCSGYDTAIFEDVGVLHGWNIDKVTPGDLSKMKIYGECAQLIGKPKTLPGFNTL